MRFDDEIRQLLAMPLSGTKIHVKRVSHTDERFLNEEATLQVMQLVNFKTVILESVMRNPRSWAYLFDSLKGDTSPLKAGLVHNLETVAKVVSAQLGEGTMGDITTPDSESWGKSITFHPQGKSDQIRIVCWTFS